MDNLFIISLMAICVIKGKDSTSSRNMHHPLYRGQHTLVFHHMTDWKYVPLPLLLIHQVPQARTTVLVTSLHQGHLYPNRLINLPSTLK